MAKSPNSCGFEDHGEMIILEKNKPMAKIVSLDIDKVDKDNSFVGL